MRSTFSGRIWLSYLLAVIGFGLAASSQGLVAQSGPVKEGVHRPVLWYCLHYQAKGENRYAPDGAYHDVLEILRRKFEVRVSDVEPTVGTLRGVDVILIANPNDRAFGTNPPPAHLSGLNIGTLTRFIRRGGGLILMGNQENHNLEMTAVNQLLGSFGMRFETNYTDLKRFTFSITVPAEPLAQLRWAYYSGNQIQLDPNHPAHPKPWIINNSADPILKGQRNTAGILLAGATLGRGRIIVVTDSGWISANALNGVGIGGYYIADHDNPEIIQRMVDWAAGKNGKL